MVYHLGIEEIDKLTKMAKARSTKSIAVFLLFMMPALSVLVAYAAYFKTINQKPICYNCVDTFNIGTKSSITNTLNKIEQYRQALIAEFNRLEQNQLTEIPLFRRQTKTDLAFLQEKINSIYKKYYGENSADNSFYNRIAPSRYLASQNGVIEPEPITTSNRREITKEINQFIFENSPIFATGAGRTILASSTLNENIIANKYPNYSLPTKTNSPVYSGPVSTAPSPINDLTNTPLFVVSESELVTDPAINYVPLSKSQYYMAFGLLTLSLMMKQRSKSKFQPI